ncbi:MAG: diguanylate cyclase [Nitrospirae bacterium]|nr:diguanylate cyclase [Nitrospirota bacterium]
MKVLIADISAETINVLGQILQNQGYECCFTDSSGDIIEQVYREFPDVIFLTVHIDARHSLKVLEKLKAAPSTREIPVILIGSTRARKTLTRGFQLGAYDYISQPYFKEEVLARLRNIIYVRNKTKEIEYMMDRDSLTGLYNRSFFMSRLIEELSWAMSYNEPLSLVMLDIDFFKRINDTYGHRCGDEVLRKMAEVMLRTVRREDVIGRFGGEEFIILMSNTAADSAAELGEALRKAVQDEEFKCADAEALHVTISAGITTFNTLCEPCPDTLIGQADNALYSAKKKGRNRVCVFGTQ